MSKVPSRPREPCRKEESLSHSTPSFLTTMRPDLFRSTARVDADAPESKSPRRSISGAFQGISSSSVRERKENPWQSR